ncbi:MAG TPA: DUF1992 domain-containing protein [Firmicutes bacterium]|nr:DUF1992 domain-containing protein [Bacillota bacterium]
MKDRAEEAIQQAMRQGKFQNLPGKGKPLKLNENPYEDPGWRSAHRVLRNGGFTLPWIEAGREIETELERCRSDLRRIWQWLRKSGSEERQAVWRQAERAFREQIEAVNQKIRAYNLQVPLDRFQMRLIDAERELAEVRAGSPPEK